MPRRSRKSMFSRFADALTGKKRGQGSASTSSDAAGASSQAELASAIVDRCMDLTREPGRFTDKIPRVQIDAIPLPAALLAEKAYRDRDNGAARGRWNSIYDDLCTMVAESETRITQAKLAGEDLSIYEKRGRGIANVYTQYDMGGRRTVLDWAGKKPVGPGQWATHFNNYIGILVRESHHWNVGFTFSEQSWETYVWTWQSLLEHFHLEDNIDAHWEYVRAEMHNLFKRWRERLKKKYMNNDKCPEIWQKFASLPLSVDKVQFAYCLWYWDTNEAQIIAERNAANRAKVKDIYIGGNVPIEQYRQTLGDAGYWPTLSHTWEAVHEKEGMDEDLLQISTQHQYNFEEAERSYRELNPELPSEDLIPPEAEISIIEHEFPSSRSYGRIPIYGGPSSLTRSTSTRPRNSSAQQPSGLSEYALEIQRLQEQDIKRNEEIAAIRAQMEQYHDEYLSSRTSYPTPST